MGEYFNRWGKLCYRESKTEKYYYGPKKRVWTQARPCPHCNALNWARFTADQYYLLPEKQIKYKCCNCKTQWTDSISEHQYE